MTLYLKNRMKALQYHTEVYVKEKHRIWYGDYPFADDIKNEILPKLNPSGGVFPDCIKRTSNVKADMTDWNITSPQIQKLQQYVINEISSLKPAKMADNEYYEMPLFFKDFWGNIYNKGDYTIQHMHWPSIYSLVYFLKSKWYDSPLVFTSFGQKIRPKEGRYVIFPGYLYHHVPKHRYGHKRITLSGNMYYKDVCSTSWYLDGANNKVSIV